MLSSIKNSIIKMILEYFTFYFSKVLYVLSPFITTQPENESIILSSGNRCSRKIFLIFNKLLSAFFLNVISIEVIQCISDITRFPTSTNLIFNKAENFQHTVTNYFWFIIFLFIIIISF